MRTNVENEEYKEYDEYEDWTPAEAKVGALIGCGCIIAFVVFALATVGLFSLPLLLGGL